MGKRFENWLSKASTKGTRRQWKARFNSFARWASTGMGCLPEQVDDIIRQDFETMPSHLFQDKYRDALTKYVASLSGLNNNTARGRITSVRSFFSSEATSIVLQRGKIPSQQMAMNEHRFNHEELHQMWLVADLQGKAILSTTVSLGWSVGDILELERGFIEKNLAFEDKDGYVTFDYLRKKTKTRARGILNPCAVHDLRNWLKVSSKKKSLWNTRTLGGMNYWIKSLVESAGIKPNGTVRFHLLRKYTFDIAVSQIGHYEGKLLVGKAIGLSDETYLHGLEDRLLERYKQFAFPFLNLDGIRAQRENKVSDLEKKLEKQTIVLDYVQKQLQEEKTLREKNNDLFTEQLEKQLRNVAEAKKDIEILKQHIFSLEEEEPRPKDNLFP